MSTLMSRDLNIERSSTRLHAPPGGRSSIVFGDENSTTSYPAKKVNEPYVPNTQNYATKNNQTSMSNLLSQQNDSDDEENEKKKKLQRRPTNSSQMTELMNPENMAPRTSTRVRQAPGGKSSLVLG